MPRQSSLTPITQARVTRSLRFFEESFRKRHGLGTYESRTQPAIFFGCYNDEDLRAIRSHCATRIIIFGGTDAMDRSRLDALGALRDTYFVAQSDFLVRDLQDAGIPFRMLPIIPTEMDRFPGPISKGNGVYVYTSDARPEFYGRSYYEPLRALFPEIPFHVCTYRSHPRDEIVDIYRQCFLGLRLVPHDGLSCTVVELGLLGIRSVYNANLPGALSFTDVDSIAEHIRREHKTIGTTDADLARRMRRFLELPPGWLTVEFFEAAPDPPPALAGSL